MCVCVCVCVCARTAFSRQLSRANMIFSLQLLSPLKTQENISAYTLVAPFVLLAVGGQLQAPDRQVGIKELKQGWGAPGWLSQLSI